MDAASYEVTLRLLRDEHLPVRATRRDDAAFGSWWLELATDPPLRLIWDGKERWAVVQSATRQRRPPSDEWQDRWIGRGPEDQTPFELVQHALEYARVTLSVIEAEVRALAERIGAQPELLPTFGASADFGRPHIEVDESGYHYIVIERGQELSRVDTTSLEHLLYLVLAAVTFDMACAHELAHRVEGTDFRRILFAHELELLGRLSTQWASRRAAEQEDILTRHPFCDR